MVDVGAKPETHRVAVAEAVITMRPETLQLVVAGSGKKGDVLSTARIAALTALKRTWQLIPLCHPVRVVGSDVTLQPDPRLPGVRAVVEVHAFDRTGVEMEALVGAAAAALTIYDMVKSVERGVVIGPIRLLEKSGGRSGLWRSAPGPRGVAKRRRVR
jgi:cyclic pyranopterin phosphate synthase